MTAALEPSSVEWRDLLIAGIGHPLNMGFNLTDLKGWTETPPPSFDDVVSGAIGARVTPVSFGRRTVTVSGWCFSPTDRDALVRALRSSTAPVAGSTVTETLTVTLAGETLSADAQLTRADATPEVGWAVGHFHWTVQWTCPDPLKYGPLNAASVEIAGSTSAITFPATSPWVFPDASPSGQIVVNNVGNASAPAVFTLNGPLNGPGLDVSGNRVTFGFNLDVGDALVIDTATGGATLNGAYRSPSPGSVRTAQLTVRPGVSTVQALGDAGSGGTPWVTASFRPAYW